MKIFYSAAFDNIHQSADNAKLRELQNSGHTVVAYNYRARGQTLGGNPFVSSRRDDEIIHFCKRWTPDFIIFSKCNGIAIRVFEECKKLAPLCYWFADPLVTYSHEEFYAKTRIADFFTCDKKNVLDKALELNPSSFLVTDGFDSVLERPRNLEKIYDLSFIGTLYGDRKSKMEQVKHPINIINNVFAEQHSMAVSQSKINLNFCTTGGQSDRVFKVLAAGGFLISDDWGDREDFFTDGEDLVIFKDYDDLNDKIAFYLEHPEEREKIEKQGRATVQQYTRKNWAAKTLRLLEGFNFAPRHKKEKETILLAGPWVGEFGWELFAWHGYIRSLSAFYDKTICVSSKHSKFLYEDFCDAFVPFDPENAGPRDAFHRSGIAPLGQIVQETLKALEIDLMASAVTIITPRRIGNPPYTPIVEKIQIGQYFVPPEYKRLGEKTKEEKAVVIHARNRSLRPNDNWSRDKWEALVKKLHSVGYNVVCIGTKEESMFVEGARDMRECESKELLNTLAAAVCIFGSSSGPMHLASLCGCPQVVWADWDTSAYPVEINRLRYNDTWNPHGTEVLFLDEYGADPPPEYVLDKFLSWGKNENT